MTAVPGARYVWRKLASAKWEDAWAERLTSVADRLAITAFAGRKTIRLEAFQLHRAEAERLRDVFGGEIVSRRRSFAMAADVVHPPIRIRQKLIIIRTEREGHALAAHHPTRKIMWIPTGMAFGTGDHATTATCLRLLADLSDELQGVPWEMLDLGTGSGILAIAGRMLGASRVDAADFDPAAVRVAKENARANGMARIHTRKFDVREWKPERKWRLIAANLYSEVLIAAAPKIAAAAASKGELILSGILRHQATEVLAAFEAVGFRVRRTVCKGKWITSLARLRR